ncbi:high affinity immunoglobulin gamma Fc receptor I [Chanos chanos]|uniref:high affinity immunoglobulin gamma Fc receptor I n=1 Tax=Chanos chanos TaxID=29144 RepID=UPI0011F1A616|nr:high affinity immunoglobulin gamma Fc receptor I-like [Chanos chanos]
MSCNACLWHSLLVVLTLLSRTMSQEPTPSPFQAEVSLTRGEVRLFSGEGDVELTCSVPGDASPLWKFQWFKGDQMLAEGATYVIDKAHVRDGGLYTCQGSRYTETRQLPLEARPSHPFHLHVDGGWAILRAPTEYRLLGESMILTCRVRGNPFLVEVIFYKDGVEFWKQSNSELLLTNVTLDDRGSYWCRATWESRLMYHSAISQPVPVDVKEILEDPQLESEFSVVFHGDNVVLHCNTQLNTREDGLKIMYYYYKDGERLGPATSSSSYVIQHVVVQDSGLYQCQATTRKLNLEKWSNTVKLDVIPPLK